MTYQEMVREFHVKMGLEVVDRFGMPNPPVLVKRLRLIAEETSELIQAIDNNDIVEIADAGCDLLYVLYGSGVAMGIQLKDTNIFYNGVSRPVFLPIQEARTIIGRLLKELGDVGTNIDSTEIIVRDVLNSMITRTQSILNMHGLTTDELFREVHRSNMSKTPLDKNRKGGKGEGYTPPYLQPIIFPSGLL